MRESERSCSNCKHNEVGAYVCWTCSGNYAKWEPPTATDLPKGEMHDSGEPVTILDEAKAHIFGDRNAAYGHPADDYAKVAKIWSGVLMGKLTKEITPREAILCMIGMKMSREAHKPKRDNVVDIAGYAGCLERLDEER